MPQWWYPAQKKKAHSRCDAQISLARTQKLLGVGLRTNCGVIDY